MLTARLLAIAGSERCLGDPQPAELDRQHRLQPAVHSEVSRPGGEAGHLWQPGL